MLADRLRKKVEASRSLPPPAVRRALREANGLNQSDIAGEIGTTKSAVSRWERGLRSPRGDLLVRYAAVLDELRRLG